jgi:membrane protein
VREASQFELIAWAVGVFTKSLPYLMIIGAFSFFYMFIPNTKVKLRAGIIAGIASGILWQTVGWLFGSIVVKATDSSTYAIYSGFALLVLFMIWMYISWVILLIGGSLAFYVQHPEYVVPTRREGGMSAQQQERLALQIMALITQRQYAEKNPMGAEQFVRRLGSQIQGVQMVLRALLDAGLIEETNHDVVRYLPKVAMEATSVLSVLNAVRSANAMPPLYRHSTQAVAGVLVIEQRIQQAINGALDNMSVKDMALQQEDKA